MWSKPAVKNKDRSDLVVHHLVPRAASIRDVASATPVSFCVGPWCSVGDNGRHVGCGGGADAQAVIRRARALFGTSGGAEVPSGAAQLSRRHRGGSDRPGNAPARSDRCRRDRPTATWLNAPIPQLARPPPAATPAWPATSPARPPSTPPAPTPGRDRRQHPNHWPKPHPVPPPPTSSEPS